MEKEILEVALKKCDRIDVPLQYYIDILTAHMFHEYCDLKVQSQIFKVLEINIIMLDLSKPSK